MGWAQARGLGSGLDRLGDAVPNRQLVLIRSVPRSRVVKAPLRDSSSAARACPPPAPCSSHQALFLAAITHHARRNASQARRTRPNSGTGQLPDLYLCLHIPPALLTYHHLLPLPGLCELPHEHRPVVPAQGYQMRVDLVKPHICDVRGMALSMNTFGLADGNLSTQVARGQKSKLTPFSRHG